MLLCAHHAAVLSLLLVLASAQLPPSPPVPPNALAGVVTAARAFAAAAPSRDSGLRRADYLITMAGIVDWFLPYQAANGAIIDPDAHVEIEYSTPCFAHAAAVLTVGGRPDLLEPAAAALEASLLELATGVCATASCDFFAAPVMRAYALLSGLVPASRAANWTRSLREIHYGTWEYTGQNWELTAAAGEYTRIVRLGLAAGTNLNWTFWEGRIGGLISRGFWDGTGIFADNTGADKISPMAYDAFGSSYIALLLAEGYNASGNFANYLAPIMEAGVWTHALYQSPLGEQPVGGRSNQHQFAEATLCAVAEIYAGRAAAAGDARGACTLQRAARLHHGSIRRWRRTDGAIQILKNWFLNHTERFGYMSYSYFSNYNLLVASWLAFAYEASDAADAIPECAALADIGGSAFALESPKMRKVFASVNGTYLELITGADPQFDASGFNRFHFDSCAAPGAASPCRLFGLLGPNQAPGISGNVAANAAGAATTGGLSMGAIWALAGDAPDAPRRSLANQTLQSILAAVVTAADGNSPAAGVSFTVQYVLWNEGVLVTETYALPPVGGTVHVTATLTTPGARSLHGLLAAAAAARDGVRVFYAPPSAPALAAAITAGYDALAAIAPPPAAPPAIAVMGIAFGAFAFDGSSNFTVTPPGAWQPDAVLVQAETSPPATDGALAFRVIPPRALNWTFDASVRVPSRNGFLIPVIAELAVTSQAPTLSYSLEVMPWQQLS